NTFGLRAAIHETAKVYGLKGDDRAVIQTWREGVAAFPGHTPFRVTLGFKLLEMGARKEADAQAHEIVRRDPKSSRGYILLGNIAEQKHQMEDALSFFEKALALEPNNVLLKISTARSLMRLRRRDQALAICQDILADETLGSGASASAIRAKVGVMLAEMDLLNRAQDVLLEAADQDPANAEAWNGLGVVHYKKRQYPDALEAYRRAVALDPRLASAHSNLGALYLRMALEKRDPRLMKEALRSFDRAIAENPALASAYNGRASAHAFNNRPEQAIRDWKKALEFNPGFVEVYFNLGIMYLKTGRKAEARKILETCRERFFETLPPEEQGRLERLIAEASE
ncbi:MAG: tetratricopeptide repeat protein, partial [Candidatus Aminicenantales bacterium]